MAYKVFEQFDKPFERMNKLFIQMNKIVKRIGLTVCENRSEWNRQRWSVTSVYIIISGRYYFVFDKHLSEKKRMFWF